MCHLSFHESLPSTTSRTCMRCAPARPVRACFVRSCCSVVVQEHDLRATPVQCNAKRRLSSRFTLHSSHPALRTSHLHFSHSTLHLISNHELFSPDLIPSLLTCHLSKFFSTVFTSSEHCQHTEAWDTDAFTLYTGKASRKYLCTTKLSSSPQFFCIPKKFC